MGLRCQQYNNVRAVTFFFFFSVYVCISELLVSYGRLFDLLREVAIVFVRLLQLFFFVCVCAFVVPS